MLSSPLADPPPQTHIHTHTRTFCAQVSRLLLLVKVQRVCTKARRGSFFMWITVWYRKSSGGSKSASKMATYSKPWSSTRCMPSTMAPALKPWRLSRRTSCTLWPCSRQLMTAASTFLRTASRVESSHTW